MKYEADSDLSELSAQMRESLGTSQATREQQPGSRPQFAATSSLPLSQPVASHGTWGAPTAPKEEGQLPRVDWGTTGSAAAFLRSPGTLCALRFPCQHSSFPSSFHASQSAALHSTWSMPISPHVPGGPAAQGRAPPAALQPLCLGTPLSCEGHNPAPHMQHGSPLLAAMAWAGNPSSSTTASKQDACAAPVWHQAGRAQRIL